MLERLRKSIGSVRPGGRDVTLYTRPNCPLCHEAELAVQRAFGRSHVRLVDISGRRDLEDRYVFRVPVLVVREQVLAEGRITAPDARRAKRRAMQIQRDVAGLE
jgi:glutaredoxin